MRYLVFFLAMLISVGGAAAQLPDNIYFRAMKDEMARTKKQLHVAGSAKPLYIMFQIQKQDGQVFQSSMGGKVPYISPDQNTADPSVSVYIYSGDKHNNSSGYFPKEKIYVPREQVAESYESIRDILWKLSNDEYISTAKLADEKEVVKQRMQTADLEAEFSVSPRASFVEDITPFVWREEALYEPLVQTLALQGQQYPYIEEYEIELSFRQKNKYMLDSEGNFAQWQQPQNTVFLWAKFRNKDGYTITQRNVYALPVEESKIPSFVREKSAAFLSKIEKRYSAKKAEFYAGPVLLMPSAATAFLDTIFVDNIIETKTPLTYRGYKAANKFVPKLNRRVMSPLLNVIDRPLLRQYNGVALQGFMPVDDEGVGAQELHLVENGQLKEVPTVRSLLEGQKHSNGHARIINTNYPIASVTNLFFEPTRPISDTELEHKLLQLCREQELEYCYIIHERDGINGLAERIYTADGHREFVYGFDPQYTSKDMRSLRDIVAVGDTQVSDYHSTMGFVNPALLVGDMELMPVQDKPDSPHFVPMP